MEDKETIEVKVNESVVFPNCNTQSGIEVRPVVDELWEIYREMDRQKGLLWARLHRLERVLGLKEY